MPALALTQSHKLFSQTETTNVPLIPVPAHPLARASAGVGTSSRQLTAQIPIAPGRPGVAGSGRRDGAPATQDCGDGRAGMDQARQDNSESRRLVHNESPAERGLGARPPAEGDLSAYLKFTLLMKSANEIGPNSIRLKKSGDSSPVDRPSHSGHGLIKDASRYHG